jgi:ribosomal protein L29
MKMSELREKSPEELDAMQGRMRDRIAHLRFLVSQKKVKNVKEAGAARKDIARILTILNTKTR